MTTNSRERDFESPILKQRFPGRFDPRLLNNVDDAGDGSPGLQKLIRNWVLYYIFQGIIEQAIHMNSKKITNVLDPTNDQDVDSKSNVDTSINTVHASVVNAHIDNLTDITTRNHSGLQNIGVNDHINNITDITTRNHSGLQNITTSLHHIRYSDVELRASINDIFGSDGKADTTIDLDSNYLDNNNKIILDEISEPATPSASHGIIYYDTLNRLVFKDENDILYLLNVNVI